MIISKLATGDKKEDILLFIHGAWHGAWCWGKYFMPYFANQGYDTYALNLRKHEQPGRVKGIKTIRFSEYVEDLIQAVQQLPKPPIIIGHSMGGLILQKYLEQHTCKKAIFLAAAPPGGIVNLTARLLFTKSYTISSLLLINLYFHVDHIDKIKWAFFSDNVPENTLLFCEKNVCEESYVAFLDMLFPRIKVTANSSIPSLVIAAENDRLFSLKEVESVAKNYQSEFIVLSDIAHDIMLDTNWRHAAETIDNWLKN